MNPITKTTTQQVNASLFSIQSDINKTNGLVKEVQVLYNDLKAEGKIIDDNLQAQIDSINTQITTINGSLGTIGGQISAINTSLSNKVDNSRVVQTLSDSSDTIPSCAAVNGALANKLDCYPLGTYTVYGVTALYTSSKTLVGIFPFPLDISIKYTFSIRNLAIPGVNTFSVTNYHYADNCMWVEFNPSYNTYGGYLARVEIVLSAYK